ETETSTEEQPLVEGAPLPPGPIQEVPVSPAPVGEASTGVPAGEVLADESPAGPLAPEDETPTAGLES
ncbi:MAG TPA: hypothetical protein VF707_10455, partial [Ardenticatenaceae bacterium]